MQYFLLESFAIFIREDLKIVDKYYILKKVNPKPGDLEISIVQIKKVVVFTLLKLKCEMQCSCRV